MENKKYRIVNNFNDAYTQESYTPEHEPVEFSEERVAEIRRAEIVLGYPLIAEIIIDDKSNKDSADTTDNVDEAPVVNIENNNDGEPNEGEPNKDSADTTDNVDEVLADKKTNKKSKKN